MRGARKKYNSLYFQTNKQTHSPKPSVFGRLKTDFIVSTVANIEFNFRCDQKLMRQYLHFLQNNLAIKLYDEINGIETKLLRYPARQGRRKRSG